MTTTTTSRQKSSTANTSRSTAQQLGTPHRGHTGPRQHAAQQAVDANTSHLRFHLGHTEVDVSLPPLNKLVFYAGLSAGAVFGLIEWPIAVLTGVGHLLSDDRHHRTLQALGEALDAA